MPSPHGTSLSAARIQPFSGGKFRWRVVALLDDSPTVPSPRFHRASRAGRANDRPIGDASTSMGITVALHSRADADSCRVGRRYEPSDVEGTESGRCDRPASGWQV